MAERLSLHCFQCFVFNFFGGGSYRIDILYDETISMRRAKLLSTPWYLSLTLSGDFMISMEATAMEQIWKSIVQRSPPIVDSKVTKNIVY